MDSLSIIEHDCFGSVVGQEKSNGYINVTKLAKAYQKKTGIRRDPNQWLKSKRTQASIDHLSAVTQICVTELVQTVKGGISDLQGTWIHPRLAVRFGIWLSDEFGYLVETWFENWTKQSEFLALSQKFTEKIEKLEAKLEKTIALYDRAIAKQDSTIASLKKEVSSLGSDVYDFNYKWKDVMNATFWANREKAPERWHIHKIVCERAAKSKRHTEQSFYHAAYEAFRNLYGYDVFDRSSELNCKPIDALDIDGKIPDFYRMIQDFHPFP